MKRNLYYFVCPLGEVWRWNVERLKQYWDRFNGKKIISIVSGEGLETPDVVMKEFGDPQVRFLVSENVPHLCETASFIKGLEFLASTASDEITFYGHTKGVSYSGENLKAVKRWTDALYLLNLASPELIENLIARYHAVGCYRQVINHAGSEWHYSGTFFWVRNQALFSREWKSIENVRHGVEGYLGRHFKEEETFALTPWIDHWQLYRYPPEDFTYTAWLRDLIKKELG